MPVEDAMCDALLKTTVKHTFIANLDPYRTIIGAHQSRSRQMWIVAHEICGPVFDAYRRFFMILSYITASGISHFSPHALHYCDMLCIFSDCTEIVSMSVASTEKVIDMHVIFSA